MRKPIQLFIPLLLAVSQVEAAEQILVPWNANSDYVHPMGQNPAIADPDFNTTWYLHGAAFAAYDGPAFGGPALVGNASDTSTLDSGTGPGPLGYEDIAYFTSDTPEISGFGTTLTRPAEGNRYTAYFRIPFTAVQDFTAPRLRMLLDDGALVYLDGVLVARVNKGNNTEAYTATASDTTASKNESGLSSGNENVIQSFSLAVAGTGTTADSVVVQAVSMITAGSHTLAVSCRNNVLTSADICMGVQLLADDSLNYGITATAGNIQRQVNGAGFADDTFSFDVVLTTQDFAGVTWNQTNALPPGAAGPASGSYGTTYTFTGFPAQVDALTPGTASLNFTNTAPAVSFPLIVTATPPPAAGPLDLAPSTPVHVADFEAGAPGSSNRVRHLYDSPAMGYTGNGAVFDDLAVNAANGGTHAMRFVNVIPDMSTEAVRLHSSVRGIKASLLIRAFTTDHTTFESNDALRVALEGSADGVTWHDLGSIVPLLRGHTAGGGGGWPPNPEGIDQLIKKIGPGVAGDTGVDVIGPGAYVSLLRGTVAPLAGDAFVRVRVLQPPPPDGVSAPAALSASENLFVDNITLEIGLDPALDADGDGYSNGEEDFAGTDPASAASTPAIVTAFGLTPAVPGSTRHEVTFRQGHFRAHVLEATDDLVNWTSAGYYFGTAAGGTFTQADDSFSNHRFYRWTRRY